MIKEIITLKTDKKIQMLNITREIQLFARKHKIETGKVSIFIPHTTAGITINENCDLDVQSDLNNALKEIFPESLNIKHIEGNSAAHLMSSLIGVNLDIYIDESELLLGTWQGIYFWEFDGPRTRKYYLICEL